MKKYLVEIDASLSTCEDIKRVICTKDYYPSTDVSVTELPPIPEVNKIETGVLMSPAEICKCESISKITFIKEGEEFEHAVSPWVGNRFKLEDWKFPREFYRDIRTEWDFSSIPVGSFVVINNEDCGIVVKNERGFIGLKCHKNDIDQHMWMINTNRANIQSIRIIELPKKEEIK